MVKMFELPDEERQEMGKKGREHVLKNYSMENYIQLWIKTLTDVHEKHGSWETMNRNQWSLKKVL